MENNNNSMNAVYGIFNKLSIQQRMMLGGIVVVTLVLLGFVFTIFNQPSYSTLYSNLSQSDASSVVKELESKKVQYKIVNGGSAIQVQKNQVYKLRLDLAGKGLPTSGNVGYELFDKNTMGMSEFMQKLTYKRALEGELARTIITEKGISDAKIHLVFPEKSVFKDQQKNPSASVVLNTESGARLSSGNIDAIANVIASSVEGLEPNMVTIIDTKGRLLSQKNDDNPLTASSGKQFEIKGKVESYLSQKVQSILDNVLGYGSSVVKVNVDLNLKQVEKTIQSYDPESQVAISEQSIKSSTDGTSKSDSNRAVTENNTTNYELSKSIEKVIEGSGNISRLTVATVVNGVKKETPKGSKTEPIFEPRTDAQLQKIEQIVKSAVGYDANRKDEISVVSIPFENQKTVIQEVPPEKSPLDDIGRFSNLILIFVAIGASLFVLKGLMKRLKNEKIIIGTLGDGTNYNDPSFNDLAPSLPGGGTMGQISNGGSTRKKALLSVGDLEDEITDEALKKKARQEKITNYVTKNPTDAAKLINSWLREDEY